MKLKDTGYSAQEIKAIASQYMIETYDRFDFVAETAKGMYLYGTDQTPYLDFYAGIAVNNTGNCNEKVVEAVREQCGEIMHVFNYPYTIPQALLAQRVCRLTGMDKIFLQNSGAEANEAMIKMVRKYGVEHFGPDHYNIVTARKSFHGRTFGAMSATGQPDSACQTGFGKMTPGFTYADFNDLASFERAVTEQTIGIMIEPVQGEGGVYPATPEFMHGLRRLCDEKGLLLMLDEIQTGWCRTGALMSYMNYGITPDLITMAKALGGGLPIGAVCAKKEVAAVFTPGSHGTTFGGSPVSCAAALAQIDELERLHCSENAQEMGDYFSENLAQLPHVREVRHQGLLVGAELEPGISAAAVKHGCFDRRLLLTAIGDQILRMVPPLIVSRKECDLACEIIGAAILAAAS